MPFRVLTAWRNWGGSQGVQVNWSFVLTHDQAASSPAGTRRWERQGSAVYCSWICFIASPTLPWLPLQDLQYYKELYHKQGPCSLFYTTMSSALSKMVTFDRSRSRLKWGSKKLQSNSLKYQETCHLSQDRKSKLTLGQGFWPNISTINVRGQIILCKNHKAEWSACLSPNPIPLAKSQSSFRFCWIIIFSMWFSQLSWSLGSMSSGVLPTNPGCPPLSIVL